MIQSYCNYGIYDEDSARSFEEGDSVESLTYWDGEKLVTVEDVQITRITKDEITIETDDFDEIEISIDDIQDLE